MKLMSGLGAVGSSPSHCQRDLLCVLQKPVGTPNLYHAKIPLRNGAGDVEWCWHPFFLPHELFDTLWQERREFFDAHVRGSSAERKQLWLYLAQKSFLKKVVTQETDYDTTVPVGLHCDAGAVSDRNSLYVLTWNSLVGQGSTTQKRFVITVLPKTRLVKDGSTLDAIWKVVAWSLKALQTGRSIEF